MTAVSPPTKRALLLTLTATLVLAATGFGAVSVLDSPPEQPETLGPATPSNQTTPEPPTGPSGPTDSTTTTRTTTPAANASLQVALSGFDDVRSADGRVAGLVGRRAGTLSWSTPATVEVETVDLVVQTWVPGEGWRVAEETTVDPTGTTVSLADAFGGEGFVYANGSDARAFSNPEDGTTVVREGFVAVTATLYADGERVGRTRTIESFSFGVTNTAEIGDGRPDLVLRGGGSDPTVFAAENVAPGVRGSGQLTVGNDGTDAGVLHVTASNLTSAENGLTEPESHADHDAGGELPPNLLLRVSLHHGNATTYVVGSADRMAAYDALDAEDFTVEQPLAPGENATLLVEWYVASAAGNEIQTDSVSLDFSFTLVDDERELFEIGTVHPAKDIGSLSRHIEVGRGETE